MCGSVALNTLDSKQTKFNIYLIFFVIAFWCIIQIVERILLMSGNFANNVW